MSDDTLRFLPDPSLTFPEAFAKHLLEDPAATVLTEVVAKGRELSDRPYTLEAVDELALRGESALVSRGVVAGDRVVLCIEDPARFFAWFLASQRLGAIPVPLPSLGELDAPTAFRERVRAVCADCVPRVIVVDAEGRTLARDEFSDTAEVVAASELESTPRATATTKHVHTHSDVAFLQYTSGSTGRPKGVIVTQGNLVSNFRAIVSGAGFGPEERSLSWLPLYHDMGLIGGFLLGIYMHTQVFVMRPRAFMFRPDSWLRAMTRHRATFTVAPNFAYSLVGRKLPDSVLRDVDLSALRLAFNGAEPIDRATVEAFMRRLAPFGLRSTAMYPVYGLAECTLAVAFPPPGSDTSYEIVDREALYARGESERGSEGDGSLPIISVGRCVPGHRIRILDIESDAELPERKVGEIVVTGPSVSPGYFGAAEGGRDTVRTGDLGYLAGENLYVVDRIKDLVILRGRNYAPSDLERTIAHVKGVTRGSIVCFARPGEDGTEALVVIAALDPSSVQSIAQITTDIKRSLAESFAITSADVRIVAPGTVPKTSSGKVQRRACRELYLAGGLEEVEGIAMRAGLMADRLRTRIGIALTR